MLLRPIAVKQRKKHRKVATEVADLKSKLGQSIKNIVLSNREIRLLRWAKKAFPFELLINVESICI